MLQTSLSTEPAHVSEPPEADEDGLFDYDDEDTFTQTIIDSSGHILQSKTDTLANKNTKRSFDQFESDDENDQTLQHSLPGSPGV